MGKLRIGGLALALLFGCSAQEDREQASDAAKSAEQTLREVEQVQARAEKAADTASKAADTASEVVAAADDAVAAADEAVAILAPPCDVFEGSLTITNQSDVAKLAGCREISGDLDVSQAKGLRSLAGLEALQVIGGRLMITNCPDFVDLAPLAKLREIHNRYKDITNAGLIIVNNAQLADLNGLDALVVVDRAVFYHNEQLPSAQAEAFAKRIGAECAPADAEVVDVLSVCVNNKP